MLLDPLFDRIKPYRRLRAEIIVASFFVNLLALASPIFTIQVLTRYITNGVTGTLITLLIGVLIAVGLEFLFRLLRARITTAVCLHADKALTDQVMGFLNHIRYALLAQIPTQKRTLLTNNLDLISNAYASQNLATALDVPFALLFIIAIALLSPWLCVITILMAFIQIVLILSLSKGLDKANQMSRGHQLEKNNLIAATQMQAASIRTFNAWSRLGTLWQQIYLKAHQTTTWLTNRRSLLQSASQSITLLTTIFIYTVGATQVVNGSITIGILIGVNILAARSLMPLTRLASMVETLNKAKIATAQIHELTKLALENHHGDAPKNPPKSLSLHDCAYAYPGQRTPLFESVSLTLNAGELLAITGNNGMGKTTLLNLLSGLLTPSRGQVVVDGADLEKLSITWWRQHCANSPQDIAFFPGTLLDNLTINNPNVSMDTVKTVLNHTGLIPCVNSLQDGLKTNLLDNANHIAPGNRKRLAHARALLSNANICLFDEPNEHLDADGQTMVVNMLTTLKKQGKTLAVCTNDKTLISLADRWIDLNEKPTPKIHSTKNH